MEEAKWLSWAKQIQSISQNGLAYAKDMYDIERYEQLRDLSIEILQTYTDVDAGKIKDLFANETGYATPKVDVRGVVFHDDKLLLVQEKADGAWSIPGGWADIGYSPREIAVKEVREEAGLEVAPVRLLAVFDKSKHAHPPSPYHVYKIFILCEIVGGSIREGMETSGVGFFARNELPPLSLERITYEQVERIFETARGEGREIMFD